MSLLPITLDSLHRRVTPLSSSSSASGLLPDRAISSEKVKGFSPRQTMEQAPRAPPDAGCRLLWGLDAAAQLLLHRGAGLEPDGQAHPHQHLPGIEQTGVRPLYPGNGHHLPLRRQAGVLHRAGEGQLHLHPAQPLPAVGEIEQRRRTEPERVSRPSCTTLSSSADDPIGLTDAQDVRAGVRHDALQGLLLAHGGLQRRLIAVPARFRSNSSSIAFHSLSGPKPGFM